MVHNTPCPTYGGRSLDLESDEEDGAYTKWLSCQARIVEEFHVSIECVHVNVDDELGQISLPFNRL